MTKWSENALEELRRVTGMSVLVDDSQRATASRDFGGFTTGEARAIAQPINAAQVHETVKFAHEFQLPITPRGGGFSQSGQSVSSGGLCLDLRGLNAVGEVREDSRSIRVGCGATWRALLGQVKSKRLMPSVLPLNLDLTIGGTLSAGGFGTTSHQHGVAAGHVKSLEVALGDGRLLRCDHKHHAEVLQHVLGGAGRVGAMTEVELSLRPVLSKQRNWVLIYRQLGAFLRDMSLLAADVRATHMDGLCSSSMLGFRALPDGRRVPLVEQTYVLHIGAEFQGDNSPDELLELLHPERVAHVEDDEPFEYAMRYDTRFQVMRATGDWEKAHPWFECFLPAGTAEVTIAELLNLLPVGIFGPMFRIFVLAGHNRPIGLSFPEGERVIGFAALPTGISDSFRELAYASLRAADDVARRAGGKRYVSGLLTGTDSGDWREHFASHFDEIRQMKDRLDPHGIFQSCLPML